MGAMEPPTSLRVDSILRLSLTVTKFVPTVGRVAGASGKHENPPPVFGEARKRGMLGSYLLNRVVR